jgi:hypothetical protein
MRVPVTCRYPSICAGCPRYWAQWLRRCSFCISTTTPGIGEGTQWSRRTGPSYVVTVEGILSSPPENRSSIPSAGSFLLPAARTAVRTDAWSGRLLAPKAPHLAILALATANRAPCLPRSAQIVAGTRWFHSSHAPDARSIAVSASSVTETNTAPESQVLHYQTHERESRHKRCRSWRLRH